MEAMFKDGEEVHIGNNVKRIREIIGMKQYVLAEKCNLSHQQMSKLESSESIDDDQLEVIAKQLGVTSEFIKNFKEERPIFNIQHNNTFHDSCNSNYTEKSTINHYPVDKFLELFERFIRDDQKKTQSIEEIGKAVVDLAKEVKELKSKKL